MYNAEDVHVLVVEDSLTQAEHLRFALENTGFQVSVVRDGNAALHWLETTIPTIVVSDIVMPVMNGYELCRRIKGEERWQDIPVILLTSLSDPADVIEGLKSGADNFIVKPFNEPFLLTRIKNLLANRILRQTSGTNLGMEIYFAGEKHYLTADRMQVIDLLLSTFESAVLKNRELEEKNKALVEANQKLEEAHRDVQQSEYRYRFLAENATDIISRHDEEGRYTYVSFACRYSLGYEPEELIGTLPHDRIHPEDFKMIRPVAEAIAAGETSSRYAFRFRHHDGHYVWLETTRKIVYDGAGELEEIVAVSREITLQKRQEKALIEAREAALEAARIKSSFLANMSHEIRTPMNGVIGMADLLMHTEMNDEQRGYAEAIHTSGDALLNLINDILDFSKVEARKLELETIAFDLLETIHDTVTMLMLRAEDSGLILAYHIARTVPKKLVGDPYRLRQILTNLINNAIKFTPEGEVVTRVSLESIDDERVGLHFSVRDTGIGISEEQQDHLFEAFSQADVSDTRVYGGTGLGLAICRQLVDMMGGKIWLESELGVGTTFHFSISLGRTNPSPSLPPMPEASILVLDRHLIIRTLLEEQLRDFDLNVVVAENPEVAVEKMAASHFDICISEAPEPGSNRRALLEAFDKSGTHLITVQPIGGSLASTEGVDSAFVITRPVFPPKLRELIRTILTDSPISSIATTSPPVIDSNVPQGKSGKILVVEDNEINQILAVAHLKKLGFEQIDVANNGQEAVEAVAENQYALVMMDCQMPVMNGYEAVREIRKREKGNRRTPVLALTAHTVDAAKEKCLECGMDDILSKPFRSVDLRTKIDLWIDGTMVQESSKKAPPPTTNSVKEAHIVRNQPAPDRPEKPPELPPLLMNELLNKILIRIPERIRNLRDAYQAGDAGQIEFEAHKLKGGCFGPILKPVVSLSEVLEQCGRDGSLEAAEDLITQIELMYQTLLPQLESERKRLTQDIVGSRSK